MLDFLERFAPLSCELPLCCVGETPLFTSVPWEGGSSLCSLAADGEYLYAHGPFGLCKVGSGMHNTQAGAVVAHNRDAFPSDSSFLGSFGRHLFLRTPACAPALFVVYDMETLQVVRCLSS